MNTEGLRRAFLEHAPQRVVELAAGVVARAHPLQHEPGWHFGSGVDDPSDAVRFRAELWDYYRDRSIERPVTLRWYDGLKVRSYLGNDLSFCLFVGGSFEPNEFVFLRDMLARGMVVVDVGANEGLYTVFAAKRVGAEGRVIAIEPSSRELERLRANVALNRLRNVEIVHAALGASDGTAELAVAETGHEGQNTIGNRVANPNVATVRIERVEQTTLDRVAEGLPRLDLVKLDVEGSEQRVVDGGLATLERFRPLLLVEAEDERLASQGATRAQLLETLSERGYELFAFDATSGALRPLRPDDPDGNLVAAPSGWTPPAG